MTEHVKEKASVAELNSLHGLVANQLSLELGDPKVLALAIKFLKDNEITADMVQSESMMSLTDSIRKIAKDESTKMTVEDMLGA